MSYSRLHESASPPGDFLVIRWPNGCLLPHRIDDSCFSDPNFHHRRECSVPFQVNVRHEDHEYNCDAIRRFLLFEEAQQFIASTTLPPPPKSFKSVLAPGPKPPPTFTPMTPSSSQPSFGQGYFGPMNAVAPAAFHSQPTMPQRPLKTPSPQDTSQYIGNFDESPPSNITLSEASSTSSNVTQMPETGVNDVTVVALLEQLLAGQQKLQQMALDIQGRLTNVENAVGLSNNKVASLTDAVLEKNTEAVIGNEKTYLRKPVNKNDPPQALSMVGYQDLQDQIDAFIDGEGKHLNVTLNGENFYLDGKMLQAAQYVKTPRNFGPHVFQLVLDLTHLANYSLGYLDTGRVSGQSKRHNKAPKKLLSEDFNKLVGNLCYLCGGCVVADKSRKQWFSEVRDSLNSKGDNLFAGHPATYPSLNHIRSGNTHTPRFNDPDQFVAPPIRKRRLFDRNDDEIPEPIEPEATAADNENSLIAGDENGLNAGDK